MHHEASVEAEEEKAGDCLDRMETCKSNLDLDDSTDNNGLNEGSFLPLLDGCSFLKIDIIDTGVGISDEDQKHLF
jgi:signal transduction histidine kinase